ncbi:hypothetical protein JCM8547_005312 [Rhodosporidiobolus lusitaniae]
MLDRILPELLDSIFDCLPSTSDLAALLKDDKASTYAIATKSIEIHLRLLNLSGGKVEHIPPTLCMPHLTALCLGVFFILEAAVPPFFSTAVFPSLRVLSLYGHEQTTASLLDHIRPFWLEVLQLGMTSALTANHLRHRSLPIVLTITSADFLEPRVVLRGQRSALSSK